MVLGIFGAGGNGKMVLKGAIDLNAMEHRWSEIIFIDDVIGVSEFHGVKVYTFAETKEKYATTELEIVVSVGEPDKRELVYNIIKSANYTLASPVAQNAEVDDSVQIGQGVIVCPLAYIGADCVIEDNVFIGRGAVIGHDTTVKKHCNISPEVFIAGHCVIEERVYVGPASAMIDQIHVGEDAVIGLNAAVYKDVPANSIALGNPAKMLRREEGKSLFARN